MPSLHTSLLAVQHMPLPMPNSLLLLSFDLNDPFSPTYYPQVKVLFHDHPDLLDEFTNFLPKVRHDDKNAITMHSTTRAQAVQVTKQIRESPRVQFQMLLQLLYFIPPLHQCRP